jgi:hypothetical protein
VTYIHIHTVYKTSFRKANQKPRNSQAASIGLNPLKDLDLTEGQTFGIPSAGLGFPSARFGFPSDWLGFPSAQLGIPSVRLGTPCLRPSGAAAPRIAFGSGRRRPAWESLFRVFEFSSNSQAGVSLFSNSFHEKAEWRGIFWDGGLGNMSQGMDDSPTRDSRPDCWVAERD